VSFLEGSAILTEVDLLSGPPRLIFLKAGFFIITASVNRFCVVVFFVSSSVNKK